VVSDPVELTVSDLANLAVSIFVSGATGPATWHFDSRQTSYISPPGDFTGITVMPLDPQSPTTQSWFWLAGIDVLVPRQSGAIAAIGDSITDGAQSTVDQNHRWTNELARRIVQRDERPIGMLNEGLDGNRLLHDVLGPNGLARFETDVLSQPGLAYVIVQLGNNDIFTLDPSETVTVDQIIQGHKQLIERAHAKGLKIFGCTLNPVQGFLLPGTPSLSGRPRISSSGRPSMRGSAAAGNTMQCSISTASCAIPGNRQGYVRLLIAETMGTPPTSDIKHWPIRSI
jgi:lysophospholipase L1-like esterase